MHVENSETDWMKQALRQAEKALGQTDPNPRVGAVIVKNNLVIGRGYHQKYGRPHAEVVAINEAGDNTPGSTLYINLEPCNHHGKTPPCTDLIIKSGIKRVVCSIKDPNLLVNGDGIEKLRQAGVRVDLGLLEKPARELNETFIFFHTQKKPFVALKFAASLDGKITARNGDSKWITNPEARDYGRKIRRRYQSILVGINTVLKDDPHLGVRQKGATDPIRIVLDSSLRIPENAQILRNDRVIIATTTKGDKEKIARLKASGVTVAVFDSKNIPVPQLIKILTKKNIISVLVEGGSHVLGSFVDSGHADKVYAFQAPIIIGGAASLPAIGGAGRTTIKESIRLKNISYKKFGDNLLTVGYRA